MSKLNTSTVGYVKLELLRPGPAHNQLISPLTPYIALCGADGPVTVRMPFEHRQLLMRLRRLRYPADKDPSDDEQRQAELRDIGENIGSVLAQIPSLVAELGNAGVENAKLIHLRLALSGFELGMIPFETAIAPDGFPGSGSPLFLQMRAPICLTREIRRGKPLPVEWNRPPKILFAFAAPNGLYVPAQTHLQALREAIEPWVKIEEDPTQRVEQVKKLLTVLPDASLEKIRKACASNEYTHVHILAHGAPYKSAGEEQFGVALCNDYDQAMDIVDGERLAIALTAHDSSGMARFRPTLVSLATCDSGNIDTVITPGGSIAHQLNAAGIPWVIASQFPLWMKGSAIAAEVLYKGLLSGRDPRWVLYDLRQRLRASSPGTHDWASIVAYSSVPWDFEKQVLAFRDKQTRRKIDIKFARIDELLRINDERETATLVSLDTAQKQQLNNLSEAIRLDLDKWRSEFEVSSSPEERADRYAVSAASEKRIAVAYQLAGEADKAQAAYKNARDYYREAMGSENIKTKHWVITQYLSILAVSCKAQETGLQKLKNDYGNTWATAYQIAQWHYTDAVGINKIWALSTLAELTLLSSVYGEVNETTKKSTKDDIKRYCKEIRNLVEEDTFPLFSTRRQFRRYSTYWKDERWEYLALEALKALGEK